MFPLSVLQRWKWRCDAERGRRSGGGCQGIKNIIYDHLCFSLGWIFSNGGQYHGELPEIHYCYAAGSGGDRLQQRALSSTQEAYVVSINLGADGDDDDGGVEGGGGDGDDDDVMQVWENRRWGVCCRRLPTSRQKMMKRKKKKKKKKNA